MAAPTRVKTKKRCCKSGPRCKRCPVVCMRLEAEGLAVRHSKRIWLIAPEARKKDWKSARAKAKVKVA